MAETAEGPGAGSVPPTTPARAPGGAADAWCIVVAAGAAARFGRAKQFEALCGQRLLDRSVRTAAAACGGVVVVVPADRVRSEAGHHPGCVVVAGGPTRSASVRAGLAAVPDEAEVIVVHDAARPLAGVALFERTVAAVRGGADGAIPGVAVVDTIKEVDTSRDVADGAGVTGGRVGRTLDRSRLLAVQTPQAFLAAALRAAHAGGDDATDDAALVEAAGATVVFVPGEPTNIKITEAHDLAVAEVHLRARGER